MRLLFPVLLISCFCASSGAAQEPGSPQPESRQRTRHPAYKTRPFPDQSYIRVAPSTDWKIWISSYFPDTSASWPMEARKKLDGLLKDDSWDYVGKGDYHQNGSPAAILLRYATVPGKNRFAATKMRIVSWNKGEWKEWLLLEPDAMVREGKKLDTGNMRIAGFDLMLNTGLPAAPALHFRAVALDSSGEGTSEASEFFFNPDTRHYVAILR